MSVSAIDIRHRLQHIQLENFLPNTALGAANIGDLETLCQRYVKELGYQYFSYFAYFPIAKSNQSMSNFPLEWTSTEDGSINNSSSPVTLACQSSTTPFFWERMHNTKNVKTDGASSFITNASHHGIYDGLCVPVHAAGSEWGMLNVAKNLPNTKSTLETIYTLQLFAATLHQAVKQTSSSQQKNSVQEKSLSPREKECLDWIAAGKTAWETAQIIGITESTVAFHIRNTINKLNASNRTHAVAVGMARSLISGSHLKN